MRLRPDPHAADVGPSGTGCFTRPLRWRRLLRVSTTRAATATTLRDRSAEPMQRLAPYHGELTRHAARILGSRFEADDAVQETMVRAWTGLDRFQGRSQLRSWLYRICTNVCRDMLAAQQRRARNGLVASDGAFVVATAPIPLASGVPSDGDPAEVVLARESVRLVLMAMLQQLPPRQRAALMLREVLHWSAAEIAELLDTSVASVNSALQRARATVSRSSFARDPSRSSEVDAATRSRLNRYARALASADVDGLTALLAREA